MAGSVSRPVVDIHNFLTRDREAVTSRQHIAQRGQSINVCSSRPIEPKRRFAEIPARTLRERNSVGSTICGGDKTRPRSLPCHVSPISGPLGWTTKSNSPRSANTKPSVGFILFFTCLSQASNNLISQAGQMETYGIPNDTITATNPIFCVLLGPVIQKLLYPLLEKKGIAFLSLSRMTAGFLMTSASMAFTASIQALIYDARPCYYQPLVCPGAEGGKNQTM
jgi:hypothetical protein